MPWPLAIRSTMARKMRWCESREKSSAFSFSVASLMATLSSSIAPRIATSV